MMTDDLPRQAQDELKKKMAPKRDDFVPIREPIPEERMSANQSCCLAKGAKNVNESRAQNAATNRNAAAALNVAKEMK